jgi:nitroreductase
MDFFDITKKRRSIRQFSDQPVPDDHLQHILEAANRAPSAGNLQAYEIYVIKDTKTRQRIARDAYDQAFITQAPLVLAFCTHAERARGRYGQRGVELYAIQDATIACTFAMLAAAAQGLGTVWVGAFDTAAVKVVLGAPDGIEPVSLLPVGFPAEEPDERVRRPLDELVHEV